MIVELLEFVLLFILGCIGVLRFVEGEGEGLFEVGWEGVGEWLGGCCGKGLLENDLICFFCVLVGVLEDLDFCIGVFRV